MDQAEKISRQKELIEKYKIYLHDTKNKDEDYKWLAIDTFQTHWDIDAENFAEMFKLSFSKQVNLFYQNSWGFIVLAVINYPEKVKLMFKGLYDEDNLLKERIITFQKTAVELLSDLKIKLGRSNLNHQQDEKTISIYLAFKYPEKYYIFKNSFYQAYCKFIGEANRSTGNKLIHYTVLAEEFKNEIVLKDSELLEMHKALNHFYKWDDKNLIVQNILFILFLARLDYWIFQGNPKVYDVISSISDNALETWSVKAFKNEIKKGDKVIIWVSGEKPGCYALCEVTSDVYEGLDDENQLKYYSDQFTNEISTRVKIKITHNLATSPITKNQIDSISELSNLKVGNQGTNFSATEEEYLAILEITKTMKTKRYWLYAPGQNAEMWEDFYIQGIMGINWDELGDLKKYTSKEEISIMLQMEGPTNISRTNDTAANYEFRDIISIGDIVIVKKGRSELLGYGEIISDCLFDNKRDSYKNFRKVKWIKKGNWKTDFSLVLKTLTDITKYKSEHPDYEYYYQRLLGLMDDKKDYQMNFPLNTIFYGPPGTGKTYNTILRAAQIIENRTISDYEEAQRIFNEHLGDQIEFITFHQNYSYEDFIQGLRPDVDNGTELSFERKDGVFKRIADRALRNITDSFKPNEAKKKFEDVFNDFISPLANGDVEELAVQMKKVSFYITSISSKSIDFRKNDGDSKHSLSIATLRKMYEKGVNDLILGGLQPYYNPILSILLERGKSGNKKINKLNYVIIIDEINRANISRVFGELITLIECDKRSHGEIPLKCTLPSGEEFIVPSNLYLIGTMNTADKSIALLDIALRRRFDFEPMYPLYEIEGRDIYDVDILEKINKRIKELKGHDFQIGHSYFMGNNIDLIERMNKKVIPLLLEYFMNDEKEVKGILTGAGLTIEQDSWPLKINGVL